MHALDGRLYGAFEDRPLVPSVAGHDELVDAVDEHVPVAVAGEHKTEL